MANPKLIHRFGTVADAEGYVRFENFRKLAELIDWTESIGSLKRSIEELRRNGQVKYSSPKISEKSGLGARHIIQIPEPRNRYKINYFARF